MAPRKESFRRRNFLKYTGTGVAGIALAGCNQQEDAGGAKAGNLEGKTLKVGVLAPLPKAKEFGLGYSMVTAAELAADELSGTDKVLGADVEIVPANTKLAPAAGLQEHRRLTVQENVDVTTGIFFDSVFNVVMDSIAEQQVIHIASAGPAPLPHQRLRENYERYKYFFRCGPPNSFWIADAFLEFIELYQPILGWDRAALLLENIAPIDPFEEIMGDRINDIMDTPIVRRVSESVTNWTPIYDELENEDIDLAFVMQALSGWASVKQWSEQERQFEMGGVHLPSQIPIFWDETNGGTEHIFTANTNTPQTRNTERTGAFVESYQKRYNNYIPMYSGAMTYDAVNIYAKAVRDTGSTDPEDLIPYMESDFNFKESTYIPPDPGLGFKGPNSKYPHDVDMTCMVDCENPMWVPVWQQWQKRGGEPKMESFGPKMNKTQNYTIPEWIDGRPTEIEVPGPDGDYPTLDRW